VLGATLIPLVCLIVPACTQQAGTPSFTYASAPYLDETAEQRCVRFAAQMPAPGQDDWIDWCHWDPASAGDALNTVFYVTTRGLTPTQTELCMQLAAQIPHRYRAAYVTGCFNNPLNVPKATNAAQPLPQQEPADTRSLTPEEQQQEAWLKTIKLLLGGGWEFVAFAADSRSMVFASPYNLSRDGAIASLWYRWEFMSGQHNHEASDRFYSFVEQEEVDCTARASTQLAIVYYAGNNLFPEVSFQVRDGTKLSWSPAIRDTVGGLMISWACSHSAIRPSPRLPESKHE
jgi:Surface-adhesin protein E